MSEAVTRHRLDGLEPDNLLAFLALLGLLRAIGLSYPDWMPRAYWNFEELPLRPVLTIHGTTTKEMICSAAIDGLEIFRQALRPFRWQYSKKDKPQKRTALVDSQRRQRSLANRCVKAVQGCEQNIQRRSVWRLRCDLIACSGGMITRKGTVFESTPLKLPSARMSFIGSMYDLAEACEPSDIYKCLFDTWKYSYKGNSLRLSPDEAQRYAYRASDPEDEGAYTEKGASGLSGLGMLSFPISEGQKHWTMPAYTGSRRAGQLSWPIWSANGGKGSSLCAIEAMLQSLPVAGHDSTKLFGPAAMVATARRYVLDRTKGDYGNIGRAEIEPLFE
jgi:hypothetical protein